MTASVSPSASNSRVHLNGRACRQAILSSIFLVSLSGCPDFERGPTWDSTLTESDSDTESTDPDAVPDYALSIHPMLWMRCGACHSSGGNAGTTNFVMSNMPDEDASTIIDHIRTSAPAQSPLLTKGQGVGHSGGAIFMTDGADAQLLLAWIEAGAPI